MTDSDDFSRPTDESSRSLRIFPAAGTSASTFTLYEDDGLTLRYRDGDFAEIRFEMTTSATAVRLRAGVSGDYPLPYRRIRIVAPAGESRRLELESERIELTAS